jgi:hypothetical protein
MLEIKKAYKEKGAPFRGSFFNRSWFYLNLTIFKGLRLPSSGLMK